MYFVIVDDFWDIKENINLLKLSLIFLKKSSVFN